MKPLLTNIEAERARAGMTIEQLCEKIGVTRRTYQRYVRGEAIPSSKLLTMSSIFGCSTDYLLGIQGAAVANM